MSNSAYRAIIWTAAQAHMRHHCIKHCAAANDAT